MQLILRVTTRCNFDCTFCSASNLCEQKDMSIDDCYDLIVSHKTQSVIFEGGDPLCISPDFYRELFRRLDAVGYKTSYGFTSNLWAFYLNPDNWLDIFARPDVSVCTSFQYGNARRISANKVYTEDLFINVYDKFKKLVNKPLSFIAVIDETNEDSALKTVRLAKTLGTYCKLNPKFEAGRSTTNYPWYKMLGIYEQVICNGLSEYEDNSYALVQMVTNSYKDCSCPFARDCGSHFLCATPDLRLTNCSVANSNEYKLGNTKFHDIAKDEFVIDAKCFACPYFKYCNSCRIRIKECRAQALDVHCSHVKKTMENIIKYVTNHSNNQ